MNNKQIKVVSFREKGPKDVIRIVDPEGEAVGSTGAFGHGMSLWVGWIGTRSQSYTLKPRKRCPTNLNHLWVLKRGGIATRIRFNEERLH